MFMLINLYSIMYSTKNKYCMLMGVLVNTGWLLSLLCWWWLVQASGGVTAVAMSSLQVVAASWMQVGGSCFVSSGSAHIVDTGEGGHVNDSGGVVAMTASLM